MAASRHRFTLRQTRRMVRDMLSQGAGVSTTASGTGLTRQTIYRIKEDPVGAEAVLAEWERGQRKAA